ncbi:unnamed protein product [Adineta ricciae]|uniref:Uncharacterized protein n=1 Tax=Adineta ricciae TaxID=249248 RepID=A0A814L250_ADIRI|nr:unnamed protein product [Adineta ricciae]
MTRNRAQDALHSCIFPLLTVNHWTVRRNFTRSVRNLTGNMNDPGRVFATIDSGIYADTGSYKQKFLLIDNTCNQLTTVQTSTSSESTTQSIHFCSMDLPDFDINTRSNQLLFKWDTNAT